MNWKRKFALVAVPGVLALGGGVIAVQAAQSPPALSPVPSGSVPATNTLTAAPIVSTEASETTSETTSETAAETVEANEPALPDGGHADAPGANVDHQFEGVE